MKYRCQANCGACTVMLLSGRLTVERVPRVC